MTDFRFERDHVVSGAIRFDELARQAREARQYAGRWLDAVQTSAGDGLLISLIMGSHPQVVGQVDRLLAGMERSFEASSDALSDTVTRYDDAESDALVAVGDIFMGPMTPTTAPNREYVSAENSMLSSGSFTFALTEPSAHGLMPGAIQKVFDFTSLASPTYWVAWALEKITGGPNPLVASGEVLMGEWEPLSRAGDALDRLATALDDAAQYCGGAAAFVGTYWDGQASEQALSYFARLMTSIAEPRADLRKLGEEYTRVAMGINAAVDETATLLQYLYDCAFIAAASAAAAAASSWTLVGNIGWGVALYKAYKGLSAWHRLVDVLTASKVLVETVTSGAMAAFVRPGSFELEAAPLPGGN